MSDVETQVRKIIAEQLQIDTKEMEKNSSFIDDLGADSLDIVELVMAMEEAFGMDIPDEHAEKIATVGDAISYITSATT